MGTLSRKIDFSNPVDFLLGKSTDFVCFVVVVVVVFLTSKSRFWLLAKLLLLGCAKAVKGLK